MRVDAMRQIRDARGLPAILELAERGKASWQIGVHAARDLLSEEELQELLRLALRRVLEGNESVHTSKNLIAGAVRAIPDDKREHIIKAVAAGLAEQGVVLVLSPFGKVSWTLVDALSEAAQAKYWSDVVPDWIYDSEVESNEGVERLLKAHRPARRFRLSGSTRRSSMRKYFPACIDDDGRRQRETRRIHASALRRREGVQASECQPVADSRAEGRA
jgi:hypothetical protein